MIWGRLKPDNPRIIGSKSRRQRSGDPTIFHADPSGKPIKYESPPHVANRVTYFDIPQHIWDKVAKRYNIKRYHSPLAQRLTARTKPLCFWEWVQQHPEIPIIFTEESDLI